MKIDKTGINLIKRFEGCRLSAYHDAIGVLTIGYGCTTNVSEGMIISPQEAEIRLKIDLERFEKYVEKYVTVPISQNMFNALVSFTYNLGAGNLKNSTLLKLLNKRDYIGASKEFPKWNKAGGKILNGLVRRRKAEMELFLSDMGIMEYSKSKHGEYKISENFKVKEFACKDGSDNILVDADFVRIFLQQIRDHFGVPVTINSAYRTSSYNSKVGGAKSSYHMKGQAFDIVVRGKTPTEVARYCQLLGIDGIIKYNTFVHVDSRSNKYWAINDNGKVKTVDLF